jgi:hypothetical protein
MILAIAKPAPKVTRSELLSALFEAYVENQNMQCFTTKGKLHECIDRQTITLRDALRKEGVIA